MGQLEKEIQLLKEKLFVSEKRYEIAMGFSDVTVFDYDIIKNRILTQSADYELFGLPAVIENGVEEIIRLGIITERSQADIRALYEKINNGALSAKASLFVNDKDGKEHVVEILLVNIFDKKNIPIYAIGVRKDVTNFVLLKKENAYKTAISSNTTLLYEANITTDRFTSYDEKWFPEWKITKETPLMATLQQVYTKVVAPEHLEMVCHKISKESILAAYSKGARLLSCQYLRRMPSGVCEWHENTIHIIQDEWNGDILVRCYIKNSNEEKQKEKKALEEQYYYESMSLKATILYEFNLTQNCIAEENGQKNSFYREMKTTKYTDLIEIVSETGIHPHDRENFKNAYLRENVLAEYTKGHDEIVCEYRRSNLQGDFIWVRCSMHLMEDPISGDIKGHFYVNSIDEQKKQQLELIYKSQRDSLTDFYNKATLEEEITKFLDLHAAKAGMHAFLIVDVDHFKGINDNFGHAFGDVFLSQTANKIRALFRSDDILGRIGGDEFVLFMKNVVNEKAIRTKASAVCEAVTETYTQNGVIHPVSASIGIAVYPTDGKNYYELYRNSDTALYYAKEHGRNQYALYTTAMKFGATNVHEIEDTNPFLAKLFSENISEYVFRILYESSHKELAINAVLELIGKHFDASRVYIFENSYDGKYTHNTFEWCNDGIPHQINFLQKLSYTPLGDYKKNFNEEGYFYLPDIEKASPALQEILTPQAIKSMLQFSIVKNGQFVAFIGFDQCDRLRTPLQKELSECRNMANVIGIFLVEMRAVENVTKANQRALSIVNGFGSYAYVCNSMTHEILFVNDQLKKLIPTVQKGDICYKSFWKRETECENCPIQKLVQNNTNNYTGEMFNTNLKMWVKVTTSWIDWMENEKACLVDSVDITKYIAAEP